MGKRRLILPLAIFSLFALGTFNSCDSSTNDPEDVPANLIASDFIQNEDNLTWEARVTGTGTKYGYDGQQTSTKTIDDTRKVTIGAQMTVNGFSVRPMFAFDADGSLADEEPIIYIGTRENAIYAISRNREYDFTVLPKEVKTGSSWNPSDTLPPRHKSTFTITEYYKEYTNNAGKKYNDVIKTVAVFKDSSDWDPSTMRGDILEGTLEIYYAKGVGPIEYITPSTTLWQHRSSGIRREHYIGKMSRKN